MLDAPARRLLAPGLDRVAGWLARLGVAPLTLTGAGFVVGVGACVAAGMRYWPLALGLWLVNRVLDGLDGPVARRRGATELGGFLDVVADFTVYAGFVVGVAVAVPDARVACLALLTAYYVSGTAFLALSSLLERRTGRSPDAYADGRSLRFVPGLAEGTETVLVYVLFCLLPGHAALIAWLFTAAVAVTAGQRVRLGIALLRRPVDPGGVPADRIADTEPDPAGTPAPAPVTAGTHRTHRETR
ncbi:membrane protein [Nakamurella endophytica]|uniref:Membrane protein n=1 Tax=Nakamurella endophytica TaxID=1748367 RepID=A0A917SPR2_9ACTN|nr:CDP-alcohol phosphatidyltransferase family protein [Nakamurella endophytica]GGL89065.1 membrane protein [Nakamurella endophytica]